LAPSCAIAPVADRCSWIGVCIARGAEIAYYLAHAPPDTSLLALAQVAASRYIVEQCIEKAKGQTGLDEYEVRYWHSW